MTTVILIPGLGDVDGYIKWATRKWPKRYGVRPIIFRVGWHDKIATYESKYQALTEQLDKVGPAAVIGISAGGSLALNALRRWPDQVTCAISICGPSTMRPQDENLRRLRESPLLKQSIIEQRGQGTIAARAMTFRALHDRLVFDENVPVKRATNIRLPMIGHLSSIIFALYRRDRQMVDFIKRHTK